MLLQAYFDGSQAVSSGKTIRVLAVVCHGDCEWKPIKRSWVAMLKRHEVEHVHTTDLVSCKGIYKDWTPQHRDNLLLACVRIIGEHVALRTRPEKPGRYGFFPVTISVVLEDLLRVVQAHPETPRNADEILFRSSLAEVLEWSEQNAKADDVHLIFDRGERYYGFAHDLLTSRRAAKDAYSLKRIKNCTESVAEVEIPLQIADLFAWAVSHKHQANKANWHRRLLAVHRQEIWFDERSMTSFEVADQAPWKAWKIPPRGATKV